jgi:hypothetical protein
MVVMSPQRCRGLAHCPRRRSTGGLLGVFVLACRLVVIRIDVDRPHARHLVLVTAGVDRRRRILLAQDMRSPDAIDAAQDYHPVLGPQASATVPSTSSGGFDWVSASIGAAAGTGLLIVALAAALGMRTVGRRRRGALHA